MVNSPMARNDPRDGRIAELCRSAERALELGHAEEAAGIWQEVLELDPRHPLGLLRTGQHALHTGQPARALSVLRLAADANPQDPLVPLNISFAARAIGDTAGEISALTRALTIAPSFLPALLARCAYFERAGKRRHAARLYADLLTILPEDTRLEAWMVAPIRHARAVVQENRRELESYLAKQLGPARAGHSESELKRFEECAGAMIGSKRIYTQQPTLLHFPRLPAIPFYDNADFPWLAEVERETDSIRNEFIEIARADSESFEPYVNHPDGVPLNQWAELNHSPKWNVFFLWNDGRRVEKNCARCPKTASILTRMPMADVPGAAPSAFFSVLAPGAHIPPHTGVTNTRLIVHLPLIVPPGCRYRVGSEEREWRPGKAWIFDDTIEHEAWNEGSQPRSLLIFDIWNPLLTELEKQLVCALLAGVGEYYAADRA